MLSRLLYLNLGLACANTILQSTGLRFGSGAQDSVDTTYDNALRQPFLVVSGTASQLTYGTSALVRVLKVNGTVVAPAAGTKNESGFVETSSSAGNSFGYGVITTEHQATVNGVILTLGTSYTLAGSDALTLGVVHTVTATGGTLPSVELWWGAMDDYIGTTDSPTKEVGGFVGGAFEGATTGSVVQVSSGSEGVLLFGYECTDRALQAGCCTFNNIVSLDTDTSFPAPVTGDGSYGVYSPLGDVTDGQSASRSLGFAAGQYSDLASVSAAAAAASNCVAPAPSATDPTVVTRGGGGGYYLSGGQIAGILLGCFFFALILGVGVALILTKRGSGKVAPRVAPVADTKIASTTAPSDA